MGFGEEEGALRTQVRRFELAQPCNVGKFRIWTKSSGIPLSFSLYSIKSMSLVSFPHSRPPILHVRELEGFPSDYHRYMPRTRTRITLGTQPSRTHAAKDNQLRIRKTKTSYFGVEGYRASYFSVSQRNGLSKAINMGTRYHIIQAPSTSYDGRKYTRVPPREKLKSERERRGFGVETFFSPVGEVSRRNSSERGKRRDHDLWDGCRNQVL